MKTIMMTYAAPVLNGAIVAMSLVILSCLASTMALFMGAGQSGPDLQSLMYVQIASVPIALIALLVGRFASDTGSERRTTFKQLYAAVPQWLIFCFLIVNLLVAAGEVALLVVASMTRNSIPWTAHAPLISMVTCSIAVCVLYARVQMLVGRPVALSGRWRP